jgi:hypothetical protein
MELQVLEPEQTLAGEQLRRQLEQAVARRTQLYLAQLTEPPEAQR